MHSGGGSTSAGPLFSSSSRRSAGQLQAENIIMLYNLFTSLYTPMQVERVLAIERQYRESEARLQAENIIFKIL